MKFNFNRKNENDYLQHLQCEIWNHFREKIEPSPLRLLRFCEDYLINLVSSPSIVYYLMNIILDDVLVYVIMIDADPHPSLDKFFMKDTVYSKKSFYYVTKQTWPLYFLLRNNSTNNAFIKSCTILYSNTRKYLAFRPVFCLKVCEFRWVFHPFNYNLTMMRKYIWR